MKTPAKRRFYEGDLLASDARKLLAVADRTRSVAEVGAGRYQPPPLRYRGPSFPVLRPAAAPFRAALREKGTAMIDWRHVPSSAFDAEQAVVGDFKLVVFDAPSNYLGPSENHLGAVRTARLAKVSGDRQSEQLQRCKGCGGAGVGGAVEARLIAHFAGFASDRGRPAMLRARRSSKDFPGKEVLRTTQPKRSVSLRIGVGSLADLDQSSVNFQPSVRKCNAVLAIETVTSANRLPKWCAVAKSELGNAPSTTELPSRSGSQGGCEPSSSLPPGISRLHHNIPC